MLSAGEGCNGLQRARNGEGIKRPTRGGEHAVGEGCNGLAWMLSVDAKLIEVLVQRKDYTPIGLH